MLSAFVAIIGSLTGLALASAYDAPHSSFSFDSLAKGAVVIGGSIWSMHFIAMLAVQFPVPVDYNVSGTAISLAIAILLTGVGLYIVSAKRLGLLSIPVAALLMGSGIGGMHYIGMNAIRGCGIAYDLQLVAVSVIVAIVASIALWFVFRERGAVETFGGLVLGLAITGCIIRDVRTSFFPINDRPHLSVAVAGCIALLLHRRHWEFAVFICFYLREC
jgi:NO-binding membrane sensor protein with MHYT domain